MPGHKGNIDFSYDVTELDSTDDLFDSNGCIYQSEDLISQIYGSSSSVFSTQGNTLCIQTMISLAVSPGDFVLTSRNCHKSVVNTISLLDVNPVWIDICSNDEHTTSEVICQIKNHHEIKAVFVTSPDYFGQILEIDKIKEECKNIPLLVDNSHGSHLLFFDKHPLQLGADLCADSAHKTLPVLTGGAWLHVSKSFAEKNNVTYHDIKDKMQIFASTSPSFLTLLSLEECSVWLKNHGKQEFEKLKSRVDIVKQNAKNFIVDKFIDPVRITFDTANIGMKCDEFINYLEKFKIKSEFGVDTKTVLIPSPFNTENDWQRLNSALKSIIYKSPIKLNKNEKITHKLVMSLRESMFSKFEKVSVNDSIGRISAQIVDKCPPGIPIVIPGELISESNIELIKKTNIKFIKVVKK